MRRKRLPPKVWNKDRPFGLGGPLNSGLGGVCSRRGIVHAGCAPHCRRRKVRSAPFPPAAKTAPAPLHPKGTSAPTSWAWALLLSPPRGARRGPRIETSKRKCAAPGGREKGASASRSAPAQTSCRRRGMVGSPLRRSGTETPGPWGTLWPGEIWDTLCADFRCRWPVVDEGFSTGQGNSFCERRAARSEAERAERGAGQIRPCTPT